MMPAMILPGATQGAAAVSKAGPAGIGSIFKKFAPIFQKIAAGQDDPMLDNLAKFGPPPEVHALQGAPAGPGAALVGGQYQQMMQAPRRRLPVPMTRGESMTNPQSIGGGIGDSLMRRY